MPTLLVTMKILLTLSISRNRCWHFTQGTLLPHKHLKEHIARTQEKLNKTHAKDIMCRYYITKPA